jgi:hypothetical protein
MENFNHDKNLVYGYDEYSGSIVSTMYDVDQKNFSSTIQALPSGWAIQRHQVYWPQELYGLRPRADKFLPFFDLTISKWFEYSKSIEQYDKYFSTISYKKCYLDIHAYQFKQIIKDFEFVLFREKHVDLDSHAIEPIYYTRNQNFVVSDNHSMPKQQNFDLLKHYFIELPIRDISSAVLPNVNSSDECIVEEPEFIKPIDILQEWRRLYLFEHVPSQWKGALNAYRQLAMKLELESNVKKKVLFAPIRDRWLYEADSFALSEYSRPSVAHYDDETDEIIPMSEDFSESTF